jgi:NAD(P)-dependent dehydrogenase (short-subunit alcohol dehydrogenase family)
MQSKRLEGRVAVVTGASSGVGRAIARAFAAEGARIGLIARTTEALEVTARELRELGTDALVLPLDVADSAAVQAAADRVVERWGQLDVWVNNAMVSVFAPVVEISADEFRRVMEVNYLGYVHGTLAALRHMEPRNGGVILQVGSALAYRSIPLQSAYCASKAATRGFTDSLRSELIRKKSGIALSMLHLPAVNTPQFEVVRNRLEGHPQPVPPIYQPEVVARAALEVVLRPRRELWVGWSTTKAILGQRFIPGLLDAYVAKHAWEAQVTHSLPDGHPQRHHIDNVDAPIPGDRGAHGPFDARSRSFSRQEWLRQNGVSLGLATAGLAALGVLAVSRGRLLRRSGWAR